MVPSLVAVTAAWLCHRNDFVPFLSHPSCNHQHFKSHEKYLFHSQCCLTGNWLFRKQVWERLLFCHDKIDKNMFFLPVISLGLRAQSKCHRPQQYICQYEYWSWGMRSFFTYPCTGRVVWVFTCRYVKCVPTPLWKQHIRVNIEC